DVELRPVDVADQLRAVVGPGGVEGVVVERDAGRDAEADVVGRRRRVGGAGADLHVGQEGRAAVVAHRAPELHVGVGRAVGVAGARAAVVAGVVPGDGHLAGRLVHGDGREELAVGGGVVVDAEEVAPGAARVGRDTQADVGV